MNLLTDKNNQLDEMFEKLGLDLIPFNFSKGLLSFYSRLIVVTLLTVLLVARRSYQRASFLHGQAR